MSSHFVDLTWSRDENKHYEIVPAQERTGQLEPPRPPPPWDTLSAISPAAWFSSTQKPEPERYTYIEPARIVWRGSKLTEWQPMKLDDRFLYKFADVSGEDDALGFVRRFGFLWARDAENCRIGEKVSDILAMADLFRFWFSVRKGGGQAAVADSIKQFRIPLEAELAPNRGGESALALRYVVGTLADGMWLRLALALAGGLKYERCDHCSKLLKVGAGTGRRAKRSDVKHRFCNSECRSRFWNRPQQAEKLNDRS